MAYWPAKKREKTSLVRSPCVCKVKGPFGRANTKAKKKMDRTSGTSYRGGYLALFLNLLEVRGEHR